MDALEVIHEDTTIDVFGFRKENFIPQAEIGGAATFLEFAAAADGQLFV